MDRLAKIDSFDLRSELDKIDDSIINEVVEGYYNSRVKILSVIWDKGKAIYISTGGININYSELERQTGRDDQNLKRWFDLFKKYEDSKEKFIKEYAEPKALLWAQKALGINKLDKIFITRPIPEGVFNIIYCDPPWKYDFTETNNRKIENQYPTMDIEEICELKLPEVADNALLLIWATAPKLKEALIVIESWGFTYKTHGIWDKKKIGMGYWFRGQHELLLIATKGDFPPPIAEKRNSSIYSEERKGHSNKPEYYYKWIEKTYPTGKAIELFSRKKFSDYWEVWGNE